MPNRSCIANFFKTSLCSTAKSRAVHRAVGGLQILDESIISPLIDSNEVRNSNLLLPALIFIAYSFAIFRNDAALHERFVFLFLALLSGATLGLQIALYLKHGIEDSQTPKLRDADFIIRIFFAAAYLVFTGTAELVKAPETPSITANVPV